MTEPAWQIRPLAAEHTHRLAECHIACWREAYRDLVPAHLLAAFDVDRRAEQWERIRVTHPGSVHVALAADAVIGFVAAGAARDEPPVAPFELSALYIRTPWYGTGLADDLLRVALTPTAAYSLWVFEENPRAQSFYRRHGFALDGARKVEPFCSAMQVRMARRPPTHPAEPGSYPR